MCRGGEGGGGGGRGGEGRGDLGRGGGVGGRRGGGTEREGGADRDRDRRMRCGGGFEGVGLVMGGGRGGDMLEGWGGDVGMRLVGWVFSLDGCGCQRWFREACGGCIRGTVICKGHVLEG